ncbi:MAG: hypothetical protein JXB17_04470 [Bacteroidales bacterium]|nr:hypothetical protein [Bacteroidales bacterium]
MKSIKLLFVAFMALSVNIACSAQTNSNNESNAQVLNENNVQVFYFHFTRRCMTCQAVEDVSKKAVTELYGDKVSFAGYNLDEENGKAKGDELGVSGQTLLIVAGDTKINITNEGFMNARSNPEKLKAIIKEKIDPLL